MFPVGRLVLVLGFAASGCGGEDDPAQPGSEDGSSGSAGSGGSAAGSTATGSGGGAGTTGAGSGGEGSGGGGDGNTGGDGSGGSGGTEPPAAICEPPVALADTSSPSAVIGSGTPESCVEEDLRVAAEHGGVITFDCGPDPVTIAITQTIELPTDADTVIDGGGKVTLDAGKQTRHFLFDHPDWLNNETKVVLQRLVLENGKAPAGEYFPPLEDPECAYGYKEGAGGAIYMRNGNLEVIDCEFVDNEAALIGPDVGGGAIYVTGSPSLLISGSRFEGNRASNGGAVGMLFTNPRIYNSVFENNTAEGIGQNTAGHDQCPEFGHEGQGGAGGLSGAVYFDGLQDEGHVFTICGSVFRNNRANELAGALFRTPNSGVRQLLIEQSTFENNTARLGGVSFIKDNEVTVRGSTFAGNRSGVNVAGEDVGGALGGLWINQGSANIENSTFYDNQPSGLDVEGEGTVQNATFSSSGFSDSLTLNGCLIVDVDCSSAAPGAGNVQWTTGEACVEGVTFADPGLGELGDHGGPTPTLLPANPSAVEGAATDCPATDQRGVARDTASCAAGAVEP